MNSEVTVRSHQRLGRTVRSDKQRPILIKVESKALRDKLLDNTKKLKDAPEAYKKVYIKKDSHPEVRKEWARLKAVQEQEKNKPENVGHNIRIDYKRRIVYKDDVIIDKWRPHPF